MRAFDIFNKMGKKSVEHPFRQKTPQEKKEAKAKEKEVMDGVLSLARICADILKDQRYQEFAAIFKDIEKGLTQLLVDCDETDRDKYFLKMRDYQMKLRFFENILKVPHEFIESAEEIQRTIAK